MEKTKALGLFRMRLTEVLQVFRLHGMNVYIPEVIVRIEELVGQLQKDLKAG